MILFQRENTAAARVFGELPLLFPKIPLDFLDTNGKRNDFDEKLFPFCAKCQSQLKHDSYVHVWTVHQHDNAHSDTQTVGSAMKYNHLSTTRC